MHAPQQLSQKCTRKTGIVIEHSAVLFSLANENPASYMHFHILPKCYALFSFPTPATHLYWSNCMTQRQYLLMFMHIPFICTSLKFLTYLLKLDPVTLNRIKQMTNDSLQKTTSSSTAEIARDAWNGHSRSLKVIRCCANRRGIIWRPISTELALNLYVQALSRYHA